MRFSLAVTAAATLVSAAWAGPITYSGRTQVIKAGVLLVQSQANAFQQPLNPAPHVWGQLDQDRSVKPASWTFNNPSGIGTTTDAVIQRWQVGLGAGDVPALSSHLTKRDAAYWEVSLLDVSDKQLNNYNALFLPVTGTLSLSTIEREKLRRFVDGGGFLWIDFLPGSAQDRINPSPIPFVLASSGAPAFYLNTDNPVVSYPNSVGINELYDIQGNFAGSNDVMTPPVLTAVESTIQCWIGTDFYRLQPAAGPAADELTIGTAEIGDGHILVTTRGVSRWLNQGYSSTGGFVANTSFKSFNPAFTPQFATAAKLIVNGLSMGAQYRSSGAGTHHTSSQSVNIQAPLTKRWEADPPAPGTTPAIYKGLVYVTVGQTIVALDNDPTNDLDGDGNPDDGALDAPGSPTDVVWTSANLGGLASSPAIAEIPRFGSVFTNTGATDAVLVHVESGNSSLYALDTRSGAILFGPIGLGDLTPAGVPSTPVVSEGFAFVSDTTQTGNLGRVWVADLANGVVMHSAQDWKVSGAPTFAPADGAPAVGYVPILDNSGGADKIVYCPMQATTNATAGFASLWFGARGEAPARYVQAGTTLSVDTRANLQNLPVYLGTDSLGIKLSMRQLNPATGADLGPLDPSLYFTGSITQTTNGRLGLQLTALGANTASTIWTGAGQNVALRIDYTIDWGAAAATGVSPQSYVRGTVQLPDMVGGTNRIQGNIAMAANGNLFVVTAPDAGANGGSLYAIKEYGRGDFRILYRWDAFDEFQFNTLASTSVAPFQYDPAVIDYDGINDLIPFIDRKTINMRLGSGPAVKGDTVYVTAEFGKQLGFPGTGNIRFTTALLAFKADPDPLEIEVEGLNGNNFSLVQPDLARSTNKAQPNAFTALQPQQFTFEYDRSKNIGHVRLLSSASVSRERIRDVISSNVPLIIRRGGQPDIVVEPELDSNSDRTGITSPLVGGNGRGRWNPLKWEMVLNGMDSSVTPIVAGDNLYVGGGSFLPSIIRAFSNGSPPNFSQTVGLIYAVDTKIGGNDIKSPTFKRAWMSPSTLPRTWEHYVTTVEIGAASLFIPSKYILMPQAQGVRSIDDYRVRLDQGVLSSERVDKLAGGEDSVIAVGGGANPGLFDFARGDWLIADEGRFLRVDSVGNPTWASNNTDQQGATLPVGNAARLVSIGRPTHVYRTDGNGFLIADPDNNRITQIDAAGREVRTLERFKVDPLYRPIGTPDNLNTTLSRPNDVMRWITIQPQATNPFRVTFAEPFEYWVHYLIADTGNQRVIELVDRYRFDNVRRVVGPPIQYTDPSSSQPGSIERGLGMLVWQLNSELVKRRFSYKSIDRLFVPNGSGGTRPVYAFGFGNTEPGGGTLGLDNPGAGTQTSDNPTGAGGVVLYDPQNGGATNVISEFQVPSQGADVYWNNTSLMYQSNPVPAQAARHFAGLRSVTLHFVDNGAGPVLAMMVTDGAGVYELVQNGTNWQTRWMMNKDAYVTMRRSFNRPTNSWVIHAKNPSQFSPMYARRLPSGEIVMVNGYVGHYRDEPWVAPAFGINRGQEFGGEVVMLDGYMDPTNSNDPNVVGFSWNKPNLGFNSYSVTFELPPIQGVRGLLAPVFADFR